MTSPDPMVAWIVEALDHVEQMAQRVNRYSPESYAHTLPPGDEWVVRRDKPGPIVVETRHGACRPKPVLSIDRLFGDPDATHIALHDPRAVLARVEAERLIVAKYAHKAESMELYPTPANIGGWMDLQHAVKALAYGHRFDLPGWRDEWAPEGVGEATGG